MPELRETVSHTLALSIEQQQPDQTPTYTAATPGDKRRRPLSTSTNGPTIETESTSSRRRSRNTKSLPARSDSGSCRTGLRSATSTKSMSVNYTKTGRVSKAKKGLKVHDCECGRSYTRAEHLRRHRRNHAQEGAMVCKYPNCGKSFFRPDLFQRHEERHNELGILSRQPSVSSVDHSVHVSPINAPASLPMESTISLSPAVAYPQQQTTSPQPEVTPFPRYNQNLFRTPQLPRTPKIAPSHPTNHVFQSSPSFKTPSNDLKHQNMAYSTRHSNSGSVLVDGMPSSGAWPDSFAQSPYSSSSGYASPVPGPEYSHMYATPPYGAGVVRTRASSNASFIEQSWIQASQSPTSSSSMLYSWPADDKNVIVSGFPYTPVSYATPIMPSQAHITAMEHYGHFDSHNMVQMDQDEGTQFLQGEHYGMSQSARTLLSEHFLNNYWRLFHPAFPIIHRFAFDSLAQSPMLLAAMFAIDAYYGGDFCKARELHACCVELLDKRELLNTVGCDRLCDYQSIFLVEVFSLHFARRCAKTLSARFLTMYKKLVSFPNSDPSAISESLVYASTQEAIVHHQWLQWAKLSMRQRLLLSCYILEAQRSAIFPPEYRSPMTQSLAKDLPFPAHQSLWNATDSSKWLTIAQSNPLMPRLVSEAVNCQNNGSYDSFQSSVLISAYCMSASNSPLHLKTEIKHIISDDPVTTHQYLTAKLARLIPLRALLAVSGKSWILGIKLTSQPEFSALRSTLQAWIAQLWPVYTDPLRPTLKALKTSVAIVQQRLRSSGSFKLDLDGEIGLFAATLVLWAATVATTARVTATLQSLGSSPDTTTSPDTDISMIGHSRGLNHPTHVVLLDRERSWELPNSQERSPMSFVEIENNASRFVDHAMNHIASFDVQACQSGCASLLLWLKLSLCSGSFNQTEDISSPISSTEKITRGPIPDILDQIEDMVKHGWEGWNI